MQTGPIKLWENIVGQELPTIARMNNPNTLVKDQLVSVQEDLHDSLSAGSLSVRDTETPSKVTPKPPGDRFFEEPNPIRS